MKHKYYKLKRKADIAQIQFIIEGYEGMATVSTVNAENAVISVSIMPDFIQDMEGLLKSLMRTHHFEEITKETL